MQKAIIHISKSWYYSAGTKYKWIDKGYDTKGIGINMSVLRNYEWLEITVDNVEYTVNCEEASYFVNQFKSIEKHRNTEIGIVSKTLLKPLVTEVEVVKKESEVGGVDKFPLQEKLF